MLGRTDSRLRMVAILLLFSLLATATGLRLGYWQVIAAGELTAQVIAAKAPTQAEPTVRADIVDRDGVVLAKTASYDSLDAYPETIRPDDVAGIVDTLSLLLDLGPAQRASHQQVLSSGEEFATLARKLTLEESALVERAIDEGLLPGITLTPHDARTYPRDGGEADTSLASQLVGFVRADGRGGSGVERYYDEQLTTVDPGSLDLASIEGLPLGLADIDPAPLRLTIVASLQRQLEKELYNARTANDARSASAVVMDPHTGAILAAASVPSYDANEFASIASDDMRRLRNPVVSDQYEPGSVMKIFTATAALEQGKVTPSTVIQDGNRMTFWKHTVHNSDKGSKGPLPVKDVIALSRNVATAKIAKRLAPADHQRAAHHLYDLWKTVGMVGPTGVDLASEASGTWYDPARWQWAPVDLANRSFGQGIAVTLLQLARGYSTIVNGGYLVQPHVLADDDRFRKQRVLKPRVARQAKEILRHVTGSVAHYARGSLIPGYDIGGKTGTGQIWDPRKWNAKAQRQGDFKDRRFNHSFIGFVGGRKQEVVIAVRLEEPVPIKVEQGYIPLRIESYELFRMVAHAAITHLDMQKLRDPDAGRPIIGTAAARALDPDRNREAMRQRKRDARRQPQPAVTAAREQAAAPSAGATADDASMAGRGAGRSGGDPS